MKVSSHSNDVQNYNAKSKLPHYVKRSFLPPYLSSNINTWFHSCSLHLYKIIFPDSKPIAIKNKLSNLLGAKASAVTASPFNSKGTEAGPYLCKTSFSLLLRSFQTTTFPSLEPVAKYSESCVHVQHQIILVWIEVFLSTVAIKLNWFESKSRKNKVHLLSLDTERRYLEFGEKAS